MPTLSTRSTAFASSPLRIAGWKSTIPTSMQENIAGAFPMYHWFFLNSAPENARNSHRGRTQGRLVYEDVFAIIAIIAGRVTVHRRGHADCCARSRPAPLYRSTEKDTG